MKGKSIVKPLVLVTNIVIGFALVLSGNAYLFDPNDWLLPAFFGLGFIPLLILNILTLLVLLMIKPRYALLNVLAIILSWISIDRHMKWVPEAGVNTNENTLDVMSFNVRLFDLYNWEGNTTTRNEILHFLQQNRADIFCFQEFFNTNDPSYFNTLDTLLDLQLAQETHDEYSTVIHQGKSKFGIATLSNAKVIDKKRIPLKDAINNIAIYTDVVYEGDTIRVFNLHLASVHLTSLKKDIDKHIETNDQSAQIKDLIIINDRLSSGFKRRARQALLIQTYIKSSPYPVIVCGDINDTPSSFAFAVLSDGLNDAFKQKGFGLGATYIGFYPLLRIDFIFVDPSLEVTYFETKQVKLSDHRPIVCSIRRKPTDE
ncbi:MAG: endonuclease/exonuclease/phosphatase family protein [Salibacteraceae bacterium]